MSDFIKNFQEQTRWNEIPDLSGSYRLLCSDPLCSLSCANLRQGQLSVTSVHGSERHSYIFTKKDMVFAMLMFLNQLSEKDLSSFCKIFNKSDNQFSISLERL